MAICEKCKIDHDGSWGTVRPLCLDCFAEKKGITDPYKAEAAYRRTGRPKGTTEYEEAKVDANQHMTPMGHTWIRKNRKLIERMARNPYEVQWKMF